MLILNLKNSLIISNKPIKIGLFDILKLKIKNLTINVLILT